MSGTRVVIVFFVFLTTGISARLTSVITTDSGPVQGEILKTVRNSLEFSSFRGIRYGRAPVGELRFKPPVEAEPWQDVFQATQEATPCPQMDFIHDKTFVGEEDCLNLNVYSPKTDFSGNFPLLPVMVWIYGGAFEAGYTNMSLYGPDFLLENGVVVVAMNYRLGLLGFLSLHLPNVTGNAGLKDQVLALKWVQKNIRNFGGDPDSVTIFGQSAGGVAVDFHVLSEASKGLFHRSISMSASPLCEWAFSTSGQTKSRNQQLGSYLGINFEGDKQFFNELLTKSAEEIVRATQKLPNFDPRFKPTLEDPKIAGDTAFITECTLSRYKSGKFQRLPHMTGFMADEAYKYINNFMDTVNEMKNEFSEAENELLTSVTNSMPRFLRSLVKSVDITMDNAYNTLKNDFEKMMTEAFFSLGIKKKLDYMKNYDVPLFLYNISFTSNESMHKYMYNIEKKRAMHSDDLPYIWHVDVFKFSRDPWNPFVMMQDRLSRMWTNFAKHSNPTPHSLNSIFSLNAIWPQYEMSGHYLNINQDLKVTDNAQKLQSALLKQLYDKIFDEIFSECS